MAGYIELARVRIGRARVRIEATKAYISRAKVRIGL
jgi:hypothetical protein